MELVSIENVKLVRCCLTRQSEYKYFEGQKEILEKNFFGYETEIQPKIIPGFYNSDYGKPTRNNIYEENYLVNQSKLFKKDNNILYTGYIRIEYLDGNMFYFRSEDDKVLLEKYKELKERLGNNKIEFKND